MARPDIRSLACLTAVLLLVSAGCCSRPQGRISESDVLTNQWELRRNVGKVVVVAGTVYQPGKGSDSLSLPGGSGRFTINLSERLPERFDGRYVVLEGTLNEDSDGRLYLQHFADVSGCVR